ncbi:glycosyltransferase family 2 protein [Glaciecola sp. 1036]|uniref:glycosyltransferase family 2 protein n=1 Tax=Alteromonadaceae TaxID=72275 RepID=UPI003D01FAA0
MQYYQNILYHQSVEIETMLDVNEQKFDQLDILIFPSSATDINNTLASIIEFQNSSIVRRVYFIDQNENNFGLSNVYTIKNFQSYFSENSKDLKRPLLLINAGDQLYEKSVQVFLRTEQSIDIAYCDTDQVEKHTRSNPSLFPDWNPDLQLTTAYINSGVLLNKVEIFKDLIVEKSIESIAELMAIAWLKMPNIKVQHISYVLVNHKQENKLLKQILSKIGRYLTEIGANVSYEKDAAVNNISWPVNGQKLVSIIIPTKNHHELVENCINSILTKTSYKNYEILLVDNNSDDPQSIKSFERLAQNESVTLLQYPYPFNFSAINNFAVNHARGDVIAFINNDVEIIQSNWLDLMLGQSLRSDIGCVGAKLLYGDGRVQHAGVVLGYGGGAGHAHKYFPRYHAGYLKRLVASHNFLAVTAACLLVEKSIFNEAGGFNEKDLAIAFNDVDFCLKVNQLGFRNLYCADVEFYHHESVSRGLDVTKEKRARFLHELAFLQEQWKDHIQHDLSYHRFLTLKRENFSLKSTEELNTPQIN